MAKDKNWVQGMDLKKGALRDKATKAGLLKKGEKLSSKELSILDKRAKKKGDTKTERQVNLAKTFKKMKKK